MNRGIEKKSFCDLLEGYQNINEQNDNVKESKGVEHTLPKLYENKVRS